MDIQLKRGLLDYCVLAAIRDHDSYGYMIIRDMQPHVDVKESTLYPILRRLEEGGYLVVRSEEYNGRLRKYYHITPKGIEKLNAFSADWQEMLAIHDYVAGGSHE